VKRYVPNGYRQSDEVRRYHQWLILQDFAPRYVVELMKCLVRLDADFDMVTVTQAELVEWLAALPPMSVGRYNYWVSNVLAGFYRWAIEEHGFEIEVSPAWGLRTRKMPQTVPRAISDEDLTKTLAVATPARRVLLLLGALQGLRCCEIAGLRREDIMEPTTRTKGRLRVVQGKGRRERTLPLHPDVLEALHAWGMPAKGPLFIIGGTDRQCLPSHVQDRIEYAFDAAGVDSSAHKLRHWMATTLYRNTLDIDLVRELLGHKHVQTTMRYASADMTKASPAVEELRAG